MYYIVDNWRMCRYSFYACLETFPSKKNDWFFRHDNSVALNDWGSDKGEDI